MFREWNGFSKVFRFTAVQQMKTKSYRVLTIFLAALCFILPALIMALCELFSEDETKPADITLSPREAAFLSFPLTEAPKRRPKRPPRMPPA